MFTLKLAYKSDSIKFHRFVATQQASIEEESVNLLNFFQLYFEKKGYVHMIEWAGRDNKARDTGRDGTLK